MGEWTQSTIGCWNDAGASMCNQSMGSTYGTPMIRRLHDGKWALIFGNGFGSASCDAGVYIMLLDSNGAAHASNTYYLSTHTANCSKPNGIAYVSSADLDSDHITDYLYAGDLQGNVWRFDLTSSNETAWAAASTPLFTTATGQPITTKLMVIGVPPASGTGAMRLMIDFGTGQKFPASALVPVTYAPGPATGGAVQSLYGVWDWNMASWNSKSGVQYQSLVSEPTLTPSNLTAQTLTASGSVTSFNASYNVTSNPVCWSGSTTCIAVPNNSFGFKVALLGVQEQVVFNPLIFQNAVLFNTTIPAVNSPVTCTVSPDTGYTIALNLSTGGALGTGTGSFFLNSASTNTAGAQTNGTGTPFIAQAGGLTFVLTQSLGNASFSYTAGGAPPSGAPLSCVTGSKICSGSIQSASLSSKRLTWIERR
jgi:type IV pilus assembly protein PilY1